MSNRILEQIANIRTQKVSLLCPICSNQFPTNDINARISGATYDILQEAILDAKIEKRSAVLEREFDASRNLALGLHQLRNIARRKSGIQVLNFLLQSSKNLTFKLNNGTRSTLVSSGVPEPLARRTEPFVRWHPFVSHRSLFSLCTPH